MGAYSNPWSGSRGFSKGFTENKPTAKTDKEYQKYCKGKRKQEPLSYEAWCKRERKKRGMF